MAVKVVLPFVLGILMDGGKKRKKENLLSK